MGSSIFSSPGTKCQGEVLGLCCVRRPSSSVVRRASSVRRQQFLQRSSSHKPLDGSWLNLAWILLGWSPFKIVQRIPFHEELWLPWQPKEKSLKIFFSTTTGQNSIIFGRNGLYVTLYQDFQTKLISQKTWPPGDGAKFPYIAYIENLNLLLWNHFQDFNNILPK